MTFHVKFGIMSSNEGGILAGTALCFRVHGMME